VVNTTADGFGTGACSTGGSCSLRQAIDQYNADTSGTDAITFSVTDPATFDISADGTLVINNFSGVPLTVTGDGTADTFIDGGGSVEVLLVEGTGPVTLDGLTIQHGGGTVYGAGVFLSGEETLILDDVDVIDNQGVKTSPASAAPAGAGILTFAGTLSLDNSTVSDNTVTGTDPTGTVGGSGAGIWSTGTLTLDNSTVSDNTVNGSVSGGGGGGIYNGGGGTLTLDDSIVSGNTAPNGGGISSDGSVTSQDSTISNNNATAFGGGGIENYGTASLQDDTTVSGNTAAYGGGIYTGSGTLTLDSSTVEDNTASTHGGGIYEGGGNTSLTATSVVSNTPDNTYPPPTAPHITSIGDNTSPITGGAQLYLSGHGFTGATSVQVGGDTIPVGTAPGDATVQDDQDISVTAPAASPARAGAVEVTVTTPLGTSTLNPGDVVTYVAAPGLENLSQSSVGAGTTSSGVQLGLYGYGFTGATSVQIGGDSIPVGTAPGDATVEDDQDIFATAPEGTVGTVAVSVTTPEGTTPVTSGAYLTYDSVPQVDSLYYFPPGGGAGTNIGSLAGGETVNISGSGLAGATAVNFGSVPATNVTVSGDDSLSVTAPAATNAGPVDVTVVAPGGTSAVSLDDVWFYEPSGTISGGTGTSNGPSVSFLSPQSGPSVGGEPIDIFGADLTDTTAVDFGSTAAEFTVEDSGDVDAVVPAGLAVGTVPVTVTTGTGPSAVTSSLAPGAVFTTTVTPMISYVSDNGDGTVDVNGSGMSGTTTVDFGTSAGTNLTVYGDRSLTVTPPSGTGVVDVTVTTSGTTSSAITPGDAWAYLAAPAVSAVYGVDGPALLTPAGGSLSVWGGDFPASSSLDFTEAGTTTSVTPTSQNFASLQLNAPGDSPGPATVTVSGESQTSPVTPNAVVYYGPAGVSDAVPVVIGTNVFTVFANQGPNPDSVVLYGSGFTSATSVQIGGVSIPVGTALSDANVDSDDLLFVPVPGNTPLGEDHVTVTNSYGTSMPTTDDLVNVLAGTAPVAPPPPSTATSSNSAVSTSPAGTAAATIGPLTATGTGEGGVTVSQYGNGDPETSAPAGTTGQYLDVEVSSGNTFSSLTITVCGLTADQELQWFGGSGWSAMTPQSFDAITGCATATITATSSPALDQLTGTVIAAVTPSTPPPASGPPPASTSLPMVTSVTPTSGPTAGGTSVTITGTGFAGATAVHFGSMSATTFRVGSDTSITATSPAGTAGTVNVTVTTPSATSATSAGDRFTYVTVPGAPTKVSATAGNASATVTWTAPSSDGGAAITGYLVKPSRGPAVEVGDVTSDTVRGLTNGTAYSFTIAAVNSVGTGPNSARSNSVTPKATSVTVLKLSVKKVTYGDEQVESISARVSPQHSGGTVTGTVTIKASTTTLCVIKLKSAKGSCSLSVKKLVAGTYHLVATYGGSANYKGSTSTKETLVVAK
jgi:predicted outer membrane repeat protein